MKLDSMKINIKNALRGIYITLIAILCLLLFACSSSEMRAWVDGNYGIKVTVQMVNVAIALPIKP